MLFIRVLIKSLLDEGYVGLKEGIYLMLKLNLNLMKILKGEKNVVFKILDNEEFILNKELFEVLRIWRKNKVFRERIKLYIIFFDISLILILNIRFKNVNELLEVRGVGSKKIEVYGKEILNIVNGFKVYLKK